MFVNFEKDGNVVVTLQKKKMEDLETNINGFFDKGGMENKYNHHDLFDILKQHGIEITNGVLNDKGPSGNKEQNRA